MNLISLIFDNNSYQEIMTDIQNECLTQSNLMKHMKHIFHHTLIRDSNNNKCVSTLTFPQSLCNEYRLNICRELLEQHSVIEVDSMNDNVSFRYPEDL